MLANAVALLAGVGMLSAAARPAPLADSAYVGRLRPGVVVAWTALALAGPCLIGFGWAGLQAALVLSAQLPPSWEKRDLVIEGRIDDLPQAEVAAHALPIPCR